MLQSKSVFDLHYDNSPIIRLEVKSSDDVRDKIAKRFIESLGHASQWLEIVKSGDTGWVVFPIAPQELRRLAARMIAAADEFEKSTPGVPNLSVQ